MFGSQMCSVVTTFISSKGLTNQNKFNSAHFFYFWKNSFQQIHFIHTSKGMSFQTQGKNDALLLVVSFHFVIYILLRKKTKQLPKQEGQRLKGHSMSLNNKNELEITSYYSFLASHQSQPRKSFAPFKLLTKGVATHQ